MKYLQRYQDVGGLFLITKYLKKRSIETRLHGYRIKFIEVANYQLKESRDGYNCTQTIIN